ncbi:hypothetical protein D0869_07944 [Hortaea werneckii]|uniref:Uncharacterized protein n=2 Tax=Hortaea werneckii TaxID=91943 RepID=A0A3M6WNT2_HORWE|nr:hypothetical protein D0869_07944 [Hortaea werneckii]
MPHWMSMHSIAKMRDRRNTSLSISSNTSTNSTTSNFSNAEKRYLSPPVSPSLPAPVTTVTKGNNSRQWKRSTIAKVVLSICTVLLVFRYFLGQAITPQLSTSFQEQHPTQLSQTEPQALEVTTRAGQRKWTVAIPHNASFPLFAGQYENICRQSEDVQDRLDSGSRTFGLRDWRKKSPYYSLDRNYLDVADAELSGALPLSNATSTEAVCRSSLTFALETNEASFGKTLLMLWMSYGLAKKEGRAFFVDDTRWPYGTYSSFFPPLPEQGCSPPPQHHIVPCPHQARHLIVSAATAKWTFGPAFEQEYTHARQQGMKKYRHIYDLARQGFEDLFDLVGEDKTYATSRVANLKEDAAAHHGSVVGMQIRRGDLHPSEYQFSHDYIPLARYASGARSLFRKLLGDSLPQPPPGDNADEISQVLEYVHSPLLLASDDPDIGQSPELAQAAAPFTIQKAQERIMLATKTALDQSSPKQDIREPGSAYVKHVDENTGWEGGFFSALFFSLGNQSPSGSAGRFRDLAESGEIEVPEQAMRMRELVGRAYLIDLAVLGEGDGVVCAVSSAACRLLGVMLGWDAVVDGRWINVDDGRAWSWNGKR